MKIQAIQVKKSIKWLDLKKLIQYRLWLGIVVVLLWSIASCVPLLSGLLTRSVFDLLSGKAAMLNLNLWMLGMLLAGSEVLAQVIVTTWFIFGWYWMRTMVDLVRSNFFQALFRDVRVPEIGLQTGEILSRYTDDAEKATDDIINEWYRLFGEGLFAVIAFVIMFRIQPFITLTTVIPLVAIVVLIHRMRTRLEKYRTASREASSRVMNFLGEIYAAVQVIKVASAESRIVTQIEKLNRQRQQTDLREMIFNNVLDSFNWNMTNLSRGLVILLAAQAIHAHTFTIGDFALFIFYLDWLLKAPRRVGRLFTTIQLSPVSTRRLTAALPATEPEKLVTHHSLYTKGSLPVLPLIEKNSRDQLDVLEVQGLSYSYPASGRGISQIDLRLEKGSFTVITGRIGSGKSTLLQAMLGLLPATTGILLWNNQEINEPAQFFVPPRISYTPQVPRLFSTTLKDNILLGLPDDGAKIGQALWQAVMETDIETLENGLDTLIGVRGVKLSGGQIQRTAAARMLIRQAELLVFDDLSSALDVETEQKLWDRLCSHQVTTCLVVSHRKSVLQRATTIIVLKDGKIEAMGTLEVVLAQSEEMQKIWRTPEDIS